MMESHSYMQSVLSPNPASTIYASAAPSYQTQTQPPQQQHTNGDFIAVVAAGVKRGYEVEGVGVNGHGHPYQRPPPLDLNTGGRSDETPSRDASHRDSSTASPGAESQRKKQKRNKPTLSCF